MDLEWMTMDSGDCLLSQLTASAELNTTLLGPLNTRRAGGGAITVPAASKPCAVFVDADTSTTGAPLASSYEQRQLYAELDGGNEFDNNVYMQQMYFDTPSKVLPKETSLSPAASFASFDEHSQVFAEFFATPLEEVRVEEKVYTMEVTTTTTPPADGDWMEMATAVDPNLGAILNEIRSEAAQIDQRSRDGDSPFSGTATSDDDEFEAALIGRPIDKSMLIGREDESDDESDYMEESMSTMDKPKRKYSKRLGRPLTKDERRERKKAQNRAAAIRYRQKKTDSMCSTELTLHQLAKRNHALKSTIKTTQAEIDIMKRLLNDVRTAVME